MIQNIGIDIGRGCVKGYTEYKSETKVCLFNSIVATATSKEKDLDVYKNEKNIHKSSYFSANIVGDKKLDNIYCGLIASKEGHTPIQNVSDSKITEVAERLFIGALDKLAISQEVNIVLGVPNRDYRKSVLKEVIDKYKGKEIYIEDHFLDEIKIIKINDINIFRESDAALLYEIATNNPKNNKDYAMVNVGYQTMEIAFYDNELNYINKLSLSEPTGNRKILEQIKDELSSNRIYKNLFEIDDSNRYDDLKEQAYKEFSKGLNQFIEGNIGNLSEVNLYLCGGISKKLSVREEFKIVEEPQLITAKGLFARAKQLYEDKEVQNV